MVNFVDRVVLHLTAGNGGHGCASVHREKFKPLGGPDGGNGGRGGNAVLVVDPQVHTLLDFHHHPHQKAGNGKPPAVGPSKNRKKLIASLERDIEAAEAALASLEDELAAEALDAQSLGV